MREDGEQQHVGSSDVKDRWIDSRYNLDVGYMGAI